MTNRPAKTFATQGEAIAYLDGAGFIFIGAPNRWRKTDKTQTTCAYIITIASTFRVRFTPPKTI
jgi:hypothetical protein